MTGRGCGRAPAVGFDHGSTAHPAGGGATFAKHPQSKARIRVRWIGKQQAPGALTALGADIHGGLPKSKRHRIGTGVGS